jgi:hypothetical protein
MSGTGIAPKSRGWVEFAGIFYIVAAVFNGIAGIAMLSKKSLFDENSLLFAHLSFWGTVLIVVGVVQLVVGLLILRRTTFGRIAGIVLGVFSMGLWFFVIFVAPFWSIVNIALYGVLLHGLTAHRDEFMRWE